MIGARTETSRKLENDEDEEDEVERGHLEKRVNHQDIGSVHSSHSMIIQKSEEEIRDKNNEKSREADNDDDDDGSSIEFRIIIEEVQQEEITLDRFSLSSSESYFDTSSEGSESTPKLSRVFSLNSLP